MEIVCTWTLFNVYPKMKQGTCWSLTFRLQSVFVIRHSLLTRVCRFVAFWQMIRPSLQRASGQKYSDSFQSVCSMCDDHQGVLHNAVQRHSSRLCVWLSCKGWLWSTITKGESCPAQVHWQKPPRLIPAHHRLNYGRQPSAIRDCKLEDFVNWVGGKFWHLQHLRCTVRARSDCDTWQSCWRPDPANGSTEGRQGKAHTERSLWGR